jgi:hypothetical protein
MKKKHPKKVIPTDWVAQINFDDGRTFSATATTKLQAEKLVLEKTLQKIKQEENKW